MKIDNPEKYDFSPNRLKRLNPTLQRYVDDGKFAGVVALVARKGAPVFLEKFGYQDIESNKPMGFREIWVSRY
jgi:hypothetical protein